MANPKPLCTFAYMCGTTNCSTQILAGSRDICKIQPHISQYCRTTATVLAATEYLWIFNGTCFDAHIQNPFPSFRQRLDVSNALHEIMGNWAFRWRLLINCSCHRHSLYWLTCTELGLWIRHCRCQPALEWHQRCRQVDPMWPVRRHGKENQILAGWKVRVSNSCVSPSCGTMRSATGAGPRQNFAAGRRRCHD